MIRRYGMGLLMGLLLALALPAGAEGLPAAAQLLASGRADEVISLLRTHLQASPQDAAAHTMLLRTYLDTGGWDNAIAEGRQAIALEPRNSNFHLWLGRAYGEKAVRSLWVTAVGLARKTRIEFETAVSLDPRNLEARADLAEFYAEAPSLLGGGADKALAQADQISALGDDCSSLAIRAKVAEAAGKQALAEQELQAAVHNNPSDANALLNLASFYLRRNRPADVEITVNRAASLASGTVSGHVLLDGADLLCRAGRNFNGALLMLRTYINAPQHYENAPLFRAHYLQGMILEKQGDRKAAAQQYRETLALAKSFEPAQQGLKRVQ